MDIRNPFFDDIHPNLDIPSTSTGENRFKQLLDEKYREDPSKSGEIRQLLESELENLEEKPWILLISDNERELLEQIPQEQRAEIYHMYQSLKIDTSFSDFISHIIEERKKADEFNSKFRNSR